MAQVGVLKYISDNATKLSEAFVSILDTYKLLYPDEDVTQTEAIFPILWYYIRWASPIQDLILQNFDLKEFQEYGGIVSMRIVKEVMQVLKVDLGIVKVKYPDKENRKRNEPE